MRVALSTNILAPYRVPVFRELAATPGWQLRVFTNAESEFVRAWRSEAGALDVQRVASLSLPQRFGRGSAAAQTTTLHLPLGLFSALLRFAPDAIVSGELGPRSCIAAAASAALGVPLVLWAYPSRASAAAAGRVRQRLRRALLRRASAVIGMGQQAREALRALGADDARIFDAPNAHDADGIARALAGREPGALRAALRARCGARERIALVAGRLVPVKGIRELLRAWSAQPPELRAGWSLLFVGDGPEALRVADASVLAQPGEILRLEGAAFDAMPAIYAACDLLVFPTFGDTWGLVVNEAMACGLPVLCSRLAGACDELVSEGSGGNGFCTDPREPSELARALREALGAPDLRARGARSRERIASFGPARMAEDMRRAIRSTLAPEALPSAPPAPRLARSDTPS